MLPLVRCSDSCLLIIQSTITLTFHFISDMTRSIRSCILGTPESRAPASYDATQIACCKLHVRGLGAQLHLSASQGAAKWNGERHLPAQGTKGSGAAASLLLHRQGWEDPARDSMAWMPCLPEHLVRGNHTESLAMPLLHKQHSKYFLPQEPWPNARCSNLREFCLLFWPLHNISS